MVMDFYQNVIGLYRPWTEIEECAVCDGCNYELTITYKDNRKKKITGDLGGGTVDKTVTDFLCTIPELRDKLNGREGKSIWIVGGSQIINMVRKKNLIDEYILSIAPVILGEGIPLFCESEREDLVFDKARTFGQFLEVSYHTDSGIC